MGGCWCWGDNAVSFERPYPEIGFWDAFLRIVVVQLDVLGRLVEEVREGRGALLVSRVVVGKKPRLWP